MGIGTIGARHEKGFLLQVCARVLLFAETFLAPKSPEEACRSSA